MNVCAYIISDKSVKIWGLTPAERLRKILKPFKNLKIIENLDLIKDDDDLVLLKGDYIYDERIIKDLFEKKNCALKIKKNLKDSIVAIHTTGKNAYLAYNILIKTKPLSEFPELNILTISELCTLLFHKKLKKVDIPYVLPVNEKNKKLIENKLFASSYKGVTDIVTRLVWPPFAYIGTKFCTICGITPNEVTLLSLLLAIIVGILFIEGHFWTGLLLGWIMTFLDTLDGKLARVTVSSSKIGDILDHGLDILHPPYWYIAWGIGTAAIISISYTYIIIALAVIVAFYVIGRILEGLFKMLTDKFNIFCWKPFDSYFRLIIARRNPNLIILTVSLISGRPDVGLLLVAIWTTLSSVILFIRLMMAFYIKKTKGPLKSWLEEIDHTTHKNKLTTRLFIYK
jgi:phosphatidylglycerophosphate synthase